jgi:two-component system chemotaxis response regulator CheY
MAMKSRSKVEWKDLRVLVVDDMPAMRSILTDMLNTCGIAQVQELEDADSAWEVLASGARDFPDIVLLDVVLPGMSGLDLVRAIRGHGRMAAIKILMVTSEGRLDHVEEAMRAGADGYLVKPFEENRLADSLVALLS